MLALALAAPMPSAAQDVVVRDGGDRASAVILREAIAKPHVVLGGTGPLVFPRDSTITTTIIVLGRPTFLASQVQGDVIVIGSSLYLRPGVAVTGRAVAIGGSVAVTALGQVSGGVESFRDETYAAEAQPGGHTLTFQSFAKRDAIPMLQPAGLQGLLMPTYERVNGLSLPVGALLTFGDGRIEVEPSLTYRSRRGVVDPAVDVRIAPEGAVRFEGRAGFDTRSNDKWIYSDLLNSASSFFTGTDARNYFLSKGGEGRVFWRIVQPGRLFEPFVGARYERVSPLSVTGNVYSVRGRNDVEHFARPNPLVETGTIGSALLGGQLRDTSGVVVSRLRAEVEQSLSTPARTSNFTQVTLDGRIDFPTFKTQRLHMRLHAVATAGDSVTRARYAYLGHSGTLPVVEMFELGGTELVFLDSRYSIPIERVVLPMAGSPVLILRHLMGTAGVNRLPKLEQEVGIGVGLSLLRLDVTTDAARKRGTKIGIGISLAQ